MDSPRSHYDRGDGPLSPCSPSYYGVYTGLPDPEGLRRHVYSDKTEALKAAKKCKSSRFKCFYSIEEAEDFALRGPDFIPAPTTPSAGEKSSPFKAPVSQDLVKFRKCIERGDQREVENTVYTNPRYLVSSGDTPSILQEGCRYNALHVAAKFNNPTVTEFVLNCITSHEFIKRLYGEDEIKDTIKQRCDILLDLYLNTPDKAANETPLHFASKIGALEVIRILVSYDKCDKSRRNKHGQTALDVLASRRSDICKDHKKEIERLLSSDYYIAVFRPVDPVRPPVLDGPFLMPSLSSSNIHSHLDSEMRMSGVAGPMKYEEAINFKKLWKRPRGSPLTSPGSPITSPPPLAFSPSSFKKPDKVIERIGRDLCFELGVNWTEYWPFLGDFANFQKDKGVNLLERYFYKKTGATKSSNFNDSLDNLFKKLSLGKSDSKSSESKNMELSEPYPPVNFSGSLSYTYIDKTCQVYANKLYESLLTPNNHNTFINSIHKCQELVNSCVNDERYVSVEFDRIHSQLARLVSINLRCNHPELIPTSIQFLNDILKETNLSSPSFALKSRMLITECMCKKLLDALSKDVMDVNKIKDEKTIQSEWLNSAPCNCVAEMRQRPSKKKLDFRNRLSFSKSFDSSNDNKIDLTIDEDNDSDSSYMTPPTSPRLMYRNPANDSIESNGEPFSSDDEMFSADEGIPITIEGETLTDIDKIVYEAIDHDRVNPSKHPLTYQWMESCKRKFHNPQATPLILSPLSPAYLKKCEDIKLSLREHLLNNSPLSSK